MNNPIQMPEGVIIEEGSNLNHTKFILQPLEKGYGATIGNAFRRVLLSSIPGAAITGVKISEVLHEFQTIQGVVEDMTEVVLNLKQVRFKLLDKKVTRVIFHLKGPHVWTARDIQNANPQIEALDPDLHIATLNENAEFDVELRVGRGKGYVPSEEQQIVDYPIGMLPIDAIYTPIKNVIFNIEPFRVGHRTDYEKLVLDVLTDGSIAPKDAVQYSAQLLSDHVSLFLKLDQDKEEANKTSTEEEMKEQERTRIKKMLLTPVDELELSVRAHNCLKAANIKNLAELVKLQEHELLKFRNFGRKSLAELSEIVAQLGLVFGMNIEKYTKHEPKHLDID